MRGYLGRAGLPREQERKSMQRVCFQLQVRPDAIEAYRESHAAVWPDMLAALRDTGWRNYSLFLRPDGLVIGYFETDDLAATLAAMAATDVDARWQRSMAHLFTTDGPRVTGDAGGLATLTEVFNLDDQLSRL
jgi:L-rhamnose mutarotase